MGISRSPAALPSLADLQKANTALPTKDPVLVPVEPTPTDKNP